MNILFNIYGLYSKTNQRKVTSLEDIANFSNYSSIALTERHLNEDIKDKEIKMKDLEVMRKDRNIRSR